MLATARHQKILREIDLRGALTVTEFAQRIGVSDMTVRRDLVVLERDRQLTRVHGGAVRFRPATTDPRPGPALTIGLIVP